MAVFTYTARTVGGELKTATVEAGKVFLEVLDSSATRPWLAAVMRDHLHGRKISLPGWAAAAL